MAGGSGGISQYIMEASVVAVGRTMVVVVAAATLVAVAAHIMLVVAVLGHTM